MFPGLLRFTLPFQQRKKTNAGSVGRRRALPRQMWVGEQVTDPLPQKSAAPRNTVPLLPSPVIYTQCDKSKMKTGRPRIKPSWIHGSSRAYVGRFMRVCEKPAWKQPPWRGQQRPLLSPAGWLFTLYSDITTHMEITSFQTRLQQRGCRRANPLRTCI